MSFNLRPGTPADLEACAQICFDAFGAVNVQHGFPPELPELSIVTGLMGLCFGHPKITSFVAERGGEVIGSNFLWEADAIFGVGPITVKRGSEGGVGRALMEAVIERTWRQGAPGVRLVQAAFNARSMSLYTKLGFDIREPLVAINGKVTPVSIPGCTVRPLTEADLPACNDLCRRVHGYERPGELMLGVSQGNARLVECGGRVTGYTSCIGFFGYSVGESNRDLMALIGATEQIQGPGFLLPSRNGELFRWCLAHGLRYVQPMSLMSLGLYQEPRGAFLPSILI